MAINCKKIKIINKSALKMIIIGEMVQNLTKLYMFWEKRTMVRIPKVLKYKP